MSQPSRLPSGGTRIDRALPIRFSFDGTEYEGYHGDTIASALLANGVSVVGRGIHSGRRRGVFTAGVEEPNALVQVDWPNGVSEPMLRATTVEIEDGLRATSLAGEGRLEAARDGARFDKRFAHVEVLVAGGGEAGRAAAADAVNAHRDDRVLLVDQGRTVDPIDGVRTLARTTAIGAYDHGYVILAERRPDPRTEGRLWHVRAQRIVLATGAIERPIVFADNDRPGIMLASAAGAYVERYAVLPGRRAVVFTTNTSGLDAAAVLEAAGVEIAEILGPRTGGRVTGTEADSDGRVNAVLVDGRRVAADLLLVAGGWNPNVALWSQARGRLRFDERLHAYLPDGPLPNVEIVGAAAGDGLPGTGATWLVEPEGGDDGTRHFVDLERDSTVADLRRAVGAGLTSIEHVKRYTTIGTASDQGKTSWVNASAVAGMLLGQEPGALGMPTFRPPYTPVSFALLAGRDRGDLHDPIRTTSIHDWHVTHGAVFEDVGQWKRPRYFPRDGESMDDAVLRECGAARTGVAVMDASTLGKIDLQGPDVGLFLDRVYTNGFSKLKVGSCRYGVMCRPDGMVFDDGVTSRLADDRFHMTTTTGNAAAVLDHLEEWLQTEWPDLRVRATSVTEQWATIAIVGPKARAVLRALAPGLPPEAADFPFMTWRDATVAGIAARVFRISFSGELAYEINVPAWSGLAMWEAVMAAGAEHRITPYGTETMHVLRAEKGYPIVGQETDGTVTPQDLGMDWIVSKAKPFIGSRSHRRADAVRPDRKQLVGLLPVDPDARLPEGAQLVDEGADLGRPPIPMVGHVTSSYRSAALGRTFALGLVRGGRARIGETVRAPLADGRVIAATVADSVLFDPENTRRDG
ncbi:MAG TPA: 2Fe-2S iron-sulfur cluster-binding protein [Candidatus Limnocylindrales bacterium]|nr:2Fe-2S iron-sulfur cluster-binding protein [Candidatus Limnocylindrales bacterium]